MDQCVDCSLNASKLIFVFQILAVPPYRQSSGTDRGIYQEGINSKGHGRQSCKTCSYKIASKGRLWF